MLIYQRVIDMVQLNRLNDWLSDSAEGEKGPDGCGTVR